MERKEYETSFRAEEKYWWFVGQRFLLRRFLEKYYHLRKDLTLLDVGCGTGITLQLLCFYGKVEGLDVADDAVEFCRKRGFSIIQSDVMNIAASENCYDVATCLGVFYHEAVTDDLRGFQEIHRILKPGGRLLFMDCAFPSLYGKHDLAFHGVRRYLQKELREKLEKAGFDVEKICYYNAIFFPVVYLKRKLEKLSRAPARSEVDENISPSLNKILTFVYKTELRGLSYVSYPFGVNIFAVARKKD